MEEKRPDIDVISIVSTDIRELDDDQSLPAKIVDAEGTAVQTESDPHASSSTSQLVVSGPPAPQSWLERGVVRPAPPQAHPQGKEKKSR